MAQEQTFDRTFIYLQRHAGILFRPDPTLPGHPTDFDARRDRSLLDFL